uniref:Tetratricopeptide domain protein n=1 Tax=Cyanothece sp. (strain PCC 7425 / ATCC 29141) TaxID=395961 RepID=B8HVX8_CYAP4
MDTDNFLIWLGVMTIVAGVGLVSLVGAYRGSNPNPLFTQPVSLAGTTPSPTSEQSHPQGSLPAESPTAVAADPSPDSEVATAILAFEKGNQAFEAKRFRWAIDKYSQAVQSQPNFAEAYHNRGLASANLGQDDDAARDLAKAAELYLEQGQETFNLIRPQLEALRTKKARKAA